MRRVLLSLQLGLLALGLAACGSDVLSVDPAASAAGKTADAGSSRVEFRIALKAAGQPTDMSGSGLFDYRNGNGTLAYKMQVPGLGPVTMDMRIVGRKVYLRLPQELAGAALPGGKPWFGLDLDKSLDRAGLGSLGLTPQQDPAQALEYLRAASTDVEESGRATVRGVQTTRYAGKLDFRKALDAGLEQLELPAAERKQARAGMKQMLDQLGSSTLPFEVFVDRDGLLRRMTMSMSMKVEGQPLSMRISIDYFDFGVPVNVKAPPAGDVTDVGGLLQP
jgi:hypothetical protein